MEKLFVIYLVYILLGNKSFGNKTNSEPLNDAADRQTDKKEQAMHVSWIAGKPMGTRSEGIAQNLTSVHKNLLNDLTRNLTQGHISKSTNKQKTTKATHTKHDAEIRVLQTAMDRPELSTPALRTKNDTCTLAVDKKSEKKFKDLVRLKKMNRVLVHVDFHFTKGTQFLNQNKLALRYKIWMWVFKGAKHDSDMYLHWPIEAGVWSLGILHSYSTWSPLNLTVNDYGNCSSVILVGDDKTDDMLGNALGQMTHTLNDSIYETNFWCYTEKKRVQSRVFDVLCREVFCPFMSTQYACCKSVPGITSDTGKCNREIYLTLPNIWWIIPFIIGLLLFLYSPIFHLSCASTMYNYYPKFANTVRQRQRSSIASFDQDELVTTVINRTYSDIASYENEGEDCIVTSPAESNGSEVFFNTVAGEGNGGSEDFVFTSSDIASNGILHTCLSPIKSCCPISAEMLSRFGRFVFPFLTLSLVFVEVFIDRYFILGYTLECIKKDVPLGFRTLSAGYAESKDKYLSFLGGPYVALTIYVILTWITLEASHDYSRTLASTIWSYSSTKSPWLLPLEVVESLGSVKVANKNENGYQQIVNVLLAQFFMLLNFKYWGLSFIIFRLRWVTIWWSKYRQYTYLPVFVFISIVPFVLFVTFCFIELIFALVWYAFPIIPYALFSIKAVVTSIFGIQRGNSSSLCTLLKYSICLICSLGHILNFFLFCLIFLESFLFLSRMAFFTYTGIIRYPKQSYGYIILLLMSLYYLADSVTNFGKIYSALLKETVYVTERIFRKNLPEEFNHFVRRKHNTFGVHIDLFAFVVERLRPRRIQIFITCLKLTCLLFILTVSIILIQTFNNFNDLDLVVHVISTLFVCALPAIVRSFCQSKKKEHRKVKLLRKDIKKAVYEYRKRIIQGSSLSLNVLEIVEQYTEYESF